MQTSVVRPEQVSSEETNTFNFLFCVDLAGSGSEMVENAVERDSRENVDVARSELGLARVLPTTEKEALTIVDYYYGPDESSVISIDAVFPSHQV